MPFIFIREFINETNEALIQLQIEYKAWEKVNMGTEASVNLNDYTYVDDGIVTSEFPDSDSNLNLDSLTAKTTAKVMVLSVTI